MILKIPTFLQNYHTVKKKEGRIKHYVINITIIKNKGDKSNISKLNLKINDMINSCKPPLGSGIKIKIYILKK